MCESRLRSGQIREADVQASKALLQMSGRLRGAASLVRSFRVDGNYILELDHAGLVAFKDNPEALAELEKLLGGHVWLARASSSNREFIEDLLYPAKVLALGTLWLPDGTKLAKAMVSGRVSRRTHPSDLIKKIAKEVRGIDVVVESEDENRAREAGAARDRPRYHEPYRQQASAQTVETHVQSLEIADGAFQSAHTGQDHPTSQSEHPSTQLNQVG
jgi:hypothetical protein